MGKTKQERAREPGASQEAKQEAANEAIAGTAPAEQLQDQEQKQEAANRALEGVTDGRDDPGAHVSADQRAGDGAGGLGADNGFTSAQPGLAVDGSLRRR